MMEGIAFPAEDKGIPRFPKFPARQGYEASEVLLWETWGGRQGVDIIGISSQHAMKTKFLLELSA